MQTYKYYLPTGERLGIFYKDGIVTVIPCSKQDQFSKKEAKLIYKLALRNTDTDTLKHWKFEVVFANQEQFLQWCNNHYKKMFYVFTPVKGKIVKVEKIKRRKIMQYDTIKISYLV